MVRKTSVKKHIRKKGKKVIPVRRHTRKVKGVPIPPAWSHVKIHQNKPYVATGRDEKGRIQYLYPKDFVKRQDKKKFKRVKRLEKKMPNILNKIDKDIEKGNEEAQALYTMYRTGFRPGTDRDTKADQKAFGTTNLEKRHVKVKPNNVVEFNFLAKKGVKVEKDVKDKKLAKIMKERDSDKRIFHTNEDKLRKYFNIKSGGNFQLKDLRTLRANKVAKKIVQKNGNDKQLVAKKVAEDLGNTPAIAVKSYIAPEVLQ
jgi:DNA topoisomerase IB